MKGAQVAIGNFDERIDSKENGEFDTKIEKFDFKDEEFEGK